MTTVVSQEKPWPVIYDQRGSQSVYTEWSEIFIERQIWFEHCVSRLSIQREYEQIFSLEFNNERSLDDRNFQEENK